MAVTVVTHSLQNTGLYYATIYYTENTILILEAITSRVEAIASRVEAIAIRLEAIDINSMTRRIS